MLPVDDTSSVQLVPSVLISILYDVCWSPAGVFHCTNISVAEFTVSVTVAGGVGSVAAFSMLLSPLVPKPFVVVTL